MKKLLPLLLLILFPFFGKSQASIDTALNFTVKACDGTTIKLFDILDEQNKIVVIDFFSVTCGPCQEYAPDFQQSYLEFGENQGNVFHMGINFGSTIEQVLAFDEAFGITYPTVSGTEGGGNAVYEAYGVLSYPTIIIIDPETHVLLRKQIYPPTVDSLRNAITAAGGIYVGVKETLTNKNSDKIKIYPNPAKSFINIKTEGILTNKTEVNVIDITGKTVLNKTFKPSEANTFKLNVSTLNNGIYFVQIFSGNNVYSRKFIINK